MRFLSKVKDVLNQPNLDDAPLYARVAAEIESGFLRDGLWAKALSEVEFDTQRAKAIYMKYAVALLKQEAKQDAKEVARIAASTQLEAMQNAIPLYNAGHYAEAIDGLVLLVERKKDLNAMVCLGNISWYGLGGAPSDHSLANEFFAAVEGSKNAEVRRFLGEVLEPSGDWERTLQNYDFAARAGSQRAGQLAHDLRRRLKERGVIKKSLWDRLSG